MDKNNLGPYSQKNYFQMGDGHSKGIQSIKTEGTFTKQQNEKWKEYLLTDKGTRQPVSIATVNKQEVKEPWKEMLLAVKTQIQKTSKPVSEIKQVSKPIPAITKSR